MKKSFELNQNALNFIHLIFFIYSAQIGHEQPALHQLLKINSVVEDRRNLIYLKKSSLTSNLTITAARIGKAAKIAEDWQISAKIVEDHQIGESGEDRGLPQFKVRISIIFVIFIAGWRFW